MALDSILRSGVALANRMTGSLQAVVTHEAWTGTDTFNKPTYATAVSRPAIVDLNQRRSIERDGTVIVSRASITFLSPIAANGASGRREPIDPRDRLTLPDGTTGPILEVAGAVDPTTGYPYAPTVALGDKGTGVSA
jgi:hypothetical protein